MSARTLAIVNPVAGGGRAAAVWAALSPGGIECVATERPGHARVLARESAARGVERVVAVGGDGTVSEVAAGLCGSKAELAIVPAGTGNDFALGLGIPSQPLRALRVALEGAVRSIDVGCIEVDGQRRQFVNVAGCGFDAEVVRRLGSVRRGGPGSLLYLAGVLRTLAAFRPRQLRLELDATVVERRALGVAVANGSRYGGGLRIAPCARVDDELLEVCIVGALGAAGIVGLLPFVYVGAHVHYPRVEFFRCHSVRIAGGATCQADGELVGDLPATFSLLPGALRVITP